MFRDALAYNLRRLTAFSGRESLDLFAPYAGAMFAFTQFAAILVLAAILLASMLHLYLSISVGGSFILVVALSAVAFCGLLAASVVRRLHDRGLSGLWGAAPLPFLTASFVIFPIIFSQFSSHKSFSNLFFVGFINNAVYLAVVCVLALQLFRRGDRIANRFGEPGSLRSGK